MTRTIAFLTLLVASSGAFAEPHLKPGYAACDSQGLLDEFTTAMTQKDERGMKYLMGRGCFPTTLMQKFDVSLLDRVSTGIIKIRIYPTDKDADTIVLYTYVEALDK